MSRQGERAPVSRIQSVGDGWEISYSKVDLRFDTRPCGGHNLAHDAQ